MVTTSIGTQPAPAPSAGLIALGIGIVATVWLVLLSGWIGIEPGSVLVQRQNVLFNSDTNTWIDEIVHEHEPLAKAVHPLEVLLWRPPCRALRLIFRAVLPREQADLLAARVLVAVVAGAGVGALAFVALHTGVCLTTCMLLLAMYLFFSSSITVALPEHFGISNGLLSIGFATPFMVVNARRQRATLAVIAALCGGTTITNAVFPLVIMYRQGVAPVRARRTMLAAAGIVLTAGTAVFVDSQAAVLTGQSLLSSHVPILRGAYMKTARIHIHVLDFLNCRLWVHPTSAAIYAVFAVLAPAIGPVPVVRISKGEHMVTYEAGQPLHCSRFGVVGYDGVRLRDYSGPSAIGALLWAALLVWSSYEAVRNRNARPLVWLPLGWIVYNLVLHNIWGDELFLYAPHWSWALMTLVILGASRVPRVALVAIVIPLMLCQAYIVVQIKAAIALIAH